MSGFDLTFLEEFLVFELSLESVFASLLEKGVSSSIINLFLRKPSEHKINIEKNEAMVVNIQV